MTEEKDLIVGAFYWVQIVLDPDAADWENQEMPARYAGDGKWNYLGLAIDSDWPVRWIGPRIEYASKIPKVSNSTGLESAEISEGKDG